jgi:ribosomal protein L11 methylase PrmA
MSRQPVFEYHAKSINIPLELPNGQNQIIQIESGYAFGTGNHFTTKLCLEIIQTLYIERSFKNVLDVGCGSGILAICAIALGSSSAIAIDIEPSVIGETKKMWRKMAFLHKFKSLIRKLIILKIPTI